MTIRLAALLVTAVALSGCASRTQVQLRDADTKEVIVGESIGKKGPLHLAHRWWMTDTNGAAYIRVPREWEALDIVVGTGEDRIDARGTLHAGAPDWVLLTPEGPSTRRIEALLVSGEGAPARITQSHD
jgi:hypothetical protein